MRVLVVEDDVRLARHIASALTEAGHDPIVVHDGERALDKATETALDLIVLDIILPGIDGFDVLRDLRSQHIASRVLMLTARGEVKDRVLNLRVGDLTLDLVSHQVYRGPRRIELSARELMLLKVLMREPGRAFTRTELCERVWEHEHEYDTKLVEVFIGRLRKKIGDPPLIHTVRYVGYTIREPL